MRKIEEVHGSVRLAEAQVIAHWAVADAAALDANPDAVLGACPLSDLKAVHCAAMTAAGAPEAVRGSAPLRERTGQVVDTMAGAALAQLIIAQEEVSPFTPLQALAEVASRAAKECTGALLLHTKDSARPVATAYVFEELAHTLGTNAVPGSLLSRALRAAASEVVTNVGELTGGALTQEALLPLLIRAVDRVGDVDAALGGVPANPRRLSLRAVAKAKAAVDVAAVQDRPTALKSTLRGLLAVVQLKLSSTSAPTLWAAYLWLERAQGWAHARWTERDARSPGRAGAAPAARKLLPTFKRHEQPCTPFPCEVALLAARMCGPRDDAGAGEVRSGASPSSARGPPTATCSPRTC
jgi:hypothetical protein